ncbi:DUF3558 family protein [Lentzea flava]|uniref:DUF3558 domain-containing protein n=1 Tax=Lentzea flava TaxID=103732 RepID=A0ABQ2UTT2_9PSEU|nr:DUF3558 family protein [Lentzea flava]MCP2201598.1 Protein of unknown function (DUF3558) [Lentzea flava]GGU53405.1 hypothetical protein GCM10010178_52870 [Lentzea flava]
MKRILIAALIATSVLTSGCTGMAGDPKPTPTTGGGTPTSNAGTSSGLESIKPCDLLTESETATLGIKTPGKEEKVGTSDGCSYFISSELGRLRVGIRAKSGLKDLNLQGDKISDIKVGKYDAKKVEAPDGAKSQCNVMISVTETSSISVIATLDVSSEDTPVACERARKAADMIAPKLP